MSHNQKITGFITIGLVVAGLATFLIPIPSLPLLSYILRTIGMFLISSGALWLLYLTVPEDDHEEPNLFFKILLVVGAFIVFGIGIFLFMLSTSESSEPIFAFFTIKNLVEVDKMFGHYILVLLPSILYMLSGILGLIFIFFVCRNDCEYIHSHFNLSKETQHVIAWASPIGAFLFMIVAWFYGTSYRFFTTIPFPALIYFFISLAALGGGIYLFFFFKTEDPLDLITFRFIGVTCFYLAAIFPAVLSVIDASYETLDECFYIISWTLLVTLTAVGVAFWFLDRDISKEMIEAMDAERVAAYKTMLPAYKGVSSTYVVGTLLAFLLLDAFTPVKNWHWSIKIILCVLAAPIWAIVAAVYDFFDFWAKQRD